MTTKTLKRNLLPFLVLVTAAILINLRQSCYSPFSTMVNCPDPAMFYMAGKAWAHGYLPYVDFIDVKGPLLFFINMAAYLATPDSMTGMFIISIAASTITLFYLYRLSALFLSSHWETLLATLLTTYAIFRVETFGTGGQCETLMIPFLAAVLFYFCRLLYFYERDTESNLKSLGWALGLGCICCFLIKYNTVPPFIVCTILSLALLYGKKAPLQFYFIFLARLLAGCFLIAAPFMYYLIHTKTLSDFWNVYFSLNASTILENQSSIIQLYSKLIRYLSNFYRRGIVSTLAILSFFCLPFIKRNTKKHNVCIALCMAVIVLSVSFCCGMGASYSYYYIFQSPVSIFPAIVIAKAVNSHVRFPIVKAMLMVVIVFSVRGLNGHTVTNTKEYNHTEHNAEKQANAIICSIPSPKILYWGILDMGYGIHTALPACPAWTALNGSPKWYRDMQKEAIAKRCADFIFTQNFVPAKGNPKYAKYVQQIQEKEDFLKQNGYELVTSYYRNNRDQLFLYKKAEAKPSSRPLQKQALSQPGNTK